MLQGAAGARAGAARARRLRRRERARRAVLRHGGAARARRHGRAAGRARLTGRRAARRARPGRRARRAARGRHRGRRPEPASAGPRAIWSASCGASPRSGRHNATRDLPLVAELAGWLGDALPAVAAPRPSSTATTGSATSCSTATSRRVLRAARLGARDARRSARRPRLPRRDLHRARAPRRPCSTSRPVTRSDGFPGRADLVERYAGAERPRRRTPSPGTRCWRCGRRPSSARASTAATCAARPPIPGRRASTRACRACCGPRR